MEITYIYIYISMIYNGLAAGNTINLLITNDLIVYIDSDKYIDG